MWGNGLPEKGHFRGLLYNASADCLIAAFSRPVGPYADIEELYYREASALDYTKIDGFGDAASLTSPVSCPAGPWVFFNVLSCHADGLDWHAVSSFDLISGEIKEIVRPGSMRGLEGQAWVSNVLSCGADGNSLVVTVGIEEQKTAFGRKATVLRKIEYWVCDLQLSDLTVTKISKLSTPFA